MTVPAEKVEVAVKTVTEQSVEISLRVTDEIKVLSQSYLLTEDGKYYIFIKRGVIATENGAGENWESTMAISRTGTLGSGEKVAVTEIYYGTEKNHILIWQMEGGSLPGGVAK